MLHFCFSHLHRAQVKAIKSALPDIRVSTVDAFQGQESDFVIFSAVRAGSSQIGFVKDMQRLNVAITRAKHALIVICDVRAMESNEGWRSLVRSANARNMLCHVPVHGSFKQQFEQFLSKSGPFAVDDPTPHRQKQHSKPSGEKDPRLQPTLQISSCAVTLPPSMQTASPASSAAKLPPTFKPNDSAPTVPSGATHTGQVAAGVVPRPQKRAASPPTRQSSPQSQLQQLPQHVLQRPGEHRVAERAIAEQERQRHMQGSQAGIQASSPVPQQTRHLIQHQQQLSQRELSLPNHQPPVKRERLNDQAHQFETVAASRGGTVAFSPSVYNLQVSHLLSAEASPQIAHLSTTPPFAAKPAPPVAAPPSDPNRSPLRELMLAVERLFAVPVLCAYVVWRRGGAALSMCMSTQQPFTIFLQNTPASLFFLDAFENCCNSDESRANAALLSEHDL
jgi:hypothetical protein